MKVQIAFDKNETRKISFQDKFPTKTKCVHCGGNSRLGFVAHEFDEKSIQKGGKYVSQLYTNNKAGKFWLHDACCVAVYFCEKCLETTALYNQA